ncbi:MAG: hypothetical protein RLZZ393_216 [Pseudomonadota bacterium]
MKTPREEAHSRTSMCIAEDGHKRECDRLTSIIEQARAEGYFERYDNPDASPEAAAERLGCWQEMIRGIYDRAGLRGGT